MRNLRPCLCTAIWTFALIGCGGGGSGMGTGPSASVSGTVREAGTDEPLTEASANVGSVQATTDASGRFELVGVPTGTVTLRAQRAGFVTYLQDIVVEEGGNTHDVRMARQTVYEVPGFAVYLPPGAPTILSVILGLASADSRSLATGVHNTGIPEINGLLETSRQMFLGPAAAKGLAIMGS